MRSKPYIDRDGPGCPTEEDWERKDKMTEPLIDNRGTTIEVGSRVAYNLSGEIGIGIVQSVKAAIKKDWEYVSRASIKVVVEYPVRLAGHVSVVKDPKNVMVIFENK